MALAIGIGCFTQANQTPGHLLGTVRCTLFQTFWLGLQTGRRYAAGNQGIKNRVTPVDSTRLRTSYGRRFSG